MFSVDEYHESASIERLTLKDVFRMAKGDPYETVL
jgi:hypothetical protein